MLPHAERWMLVAGLVMVSVNPAFAQDYASKPIRVITGSPGGSTDFTTRQVAQALSTALGQQVIVENRDGLLAAQAVAKAPPDGYTLVAAGGSLWITPLLQKTGYDAVTDFSPVSLLVRDVSLFVVHPSVPVTSIKELIALAKARPGQLNYATSGVGSTPHLATELFKAMSGINMVHIPYKGNSQALADLIGGQVQLALISAPSATPHIKSGKLRALAVTSAQPTPLAPGMPTVAATLPGFEAVGLTALFAPAKTPGAIVKRLNEEAARFLRTGEAQETFLKRGAEAVGSSPEQLAAAMKTEIERLGKLVKDLGIRAE